MIADAIAPIADAAFGLPGSELNTASAWLGGFAFTLQIYFDFSGYSDMAIGLGQMLGFRLPENFNRPYSSVSITDFWRRWHMSLSRWFRDYLYIPLGGNRGSAMSTTATCSWSSCSWASGTEPPGRSWPGARTTARSAHDRACDRLAECRRGLGGGASRRRLPPRDDRVGAVPRHRPRPGGPVHQEDVHPRPQPRSRPLSPWPTRTRPR